MDKAAVFYAVASVLVVSMISLVGLFTISVSVRKLKNFILALVALAVGALLGDAFMHLIPEAYQNNSDARAVSILIIAGIIIFFALEKFLSWQHGHGHVHTKTECLDDDCKNTVELVVKPIKPIGMLVLVSDGLHNFVDGVIIGASYLISVEVGLASTIAIVLHEIPQEIGDFGVLLHAGYTKMRALFLNFLSALTAFAGVFAALAVGSKAEDALVWILPLAAGTFVYIASSDLVPELHKRSGAASTAIQIIMIAVGVAAMYALTLIG